MISLKKSVEAQLSLCEKRISELEGYLSGFPEGTIRCYDVGPNSEWIHMKDGVRRTIPKSNNVLAERLMLKRLYNYELMDLEKEAEALRKYLNHIGISGNKLETMLAKLNRSTSELLAKVQAYDDRRINEWIHSPYRKNDRYPEGLNVRTLDGGLVRSKLEAEFANLLRTLGLPYRYEQIHLIGGRDIAADFTILDVRTFSPVIAELYGMMDNPRYREQYLRKMDLYLSNGYIPDVNMLCYHETSGHALDMAYVLTSLKAFFGKW